MHPHSDREDRLLPDDRQPLLHALQALSESLGPYVRRRLADEYPNQDRLSPAPWDGAPGDADLDDLSTQFFALTGRDRSGKSILNVESGLRSRIHAIWIARNRLAHGARLERSEMLLALSEVAEVLRIIGDVEASDRVSQELAAHAAAGTRMETSGAEPAAGLESLVEPLDAPQAGSLEEPDAAHEEPTPSDKRAERTAAGAAPAVSDPLPPAHDETARVAAPEPPPLPRPTGTGLDLLAVSVDAPPVVSYAHAVAGSRLAMTIHLRPVDIRGTDLDEQGARQWVPLEDVRVTIGVEVDGESVASGHPVILTRLGAEGEDLTVSILPERSALLQVDAQSPSRLHLLLESAGARRDLFLDGPDVLTPRQWVMRGRPSEAAATLTAFVQPQQPRLAPLCSQAAQLLGTATGSPSLNGYEGGPARVSSIVAAVCRAIQDAGVAYAVPPTSWGESGQRVRTAQDVLDNRLGTCLDTTILLASALEYLEIEPLIILLPGHALLGYWRTQRHLSEDLTMPGWELLNQIDLGEIRLVETTLLTGEASATAEQLHQAARRLIGVDAAEIDVVIPVRAARERGVVPMPLRTRHEDGEIVESTYVAAPRPNTVLLADELLRTTRPRPTRSKAPDRVEAWKARLLDLSLRNRLINCSDSAIHSHRIVELAVPEAVIGSFEDLVNAGRDITLRPAGERAAEVRRIGGLFRTELDPPQLAPLLADHREVEVDLGEGTYDPILRRLRSTARTLAEETGANNLYLALGSLVWKTGGTTIRSPLVFVPVDLERRSAHSPFRLRIDPSGTTTPNYSLVERLRIDLGLDLTELSEPEEDAAGLNLPRLFEVVRRVLADNRLPFHVEATTYLGIFQFGTFRLWKDLEESWKEIARNPLVRHLIETPDQQFADPQAHAPVVGLEQLLPRLPVAADASQAEVVAQALSGRTIVVEGPPGTGKSQTITNVIVSAIAQGRKVLFVAEKQAALEVVARRLRDAGIGGLLLDLHDRKQSPDAVRRKILAAMDLEAHPDRITLQSRMALAGADSARLAEYRASLHGRSPSGMSFYSARTAEIAYSGHRAGSLTITPAQLAAMTDGDVASLRTSIPSVGTCLDRYRDVLVGSEPVISQPLDDVSLSEVLAATARWDSVISSGDDELLAAVGTMPDHELETAALILEDPVLDTRVLDLIADPSWVRDAQWLLQQLDAEATDLRPALTYYRESVLDEPLDAVRESLINAKHAFFSKSKKAEKALARLAGHRSGKPMPDDAAALLGIVDELIALARRRDQLRERHAALLPWTAAMIRNWTPFDRPAAAASGDRLRQLLERAHLAAAGQRSQTRIIVAACAIRPDRSAIAGWMRAYSRAREGLTALSRVGIGRGAIEALLPMPAPRRERVLRGWSEFLSAGTEFRRLGLASCLDQLRRGEVLSSDASTALEIGLIHATLESQRERGRLDEFDAERQNTTVAQYAAVLDEIRSMLPEALVEDALIARGHALASEGLRLANLRTALERKRKKRRIRDLIGEFGDLITSLTPCVLVSPDSVARFFPANRQDFDLVVFDEASQITVAAAIGAMGRGRSVIICGDSKQMPPTSFAELSRDDDGEDDIVDEESILSECVAAHVPRFWLSWHYRSRVESLIAFSNAAYYQGRLSSFPSPRSAERDDGPHGFGISLRHVDGHFVRSVPRGQSRKTYRTNQAEAEAIVEEIQRRFDDDPTDPEGPSVGVVTFNIQQRDLIEARLRELDDPRITASLDAAGGIFVKNLENVQGDERDAILFSVAFSAGEDGQVPLNFGPLNRHGGERRLNVAITRARAQVVLFCSFDPASLHAERSTSAGLQDLKRYLLLAEHGTGALPARAAGQARPDGHREEIAAALRARGLAVRTDVGLSDFRIDLVLAPGDRPDEPRVAVMLDGPNWESRRTSYDRDVLPTRVLARMMHWPGVERIWMPEWLRAPEAVVSRLVGAVEHTQDYGKQHDGAAAPGLPAPAVPASILDLAAASKTGPADRGEAGPVRALTPFEQAGASPHATAAPDHAAAGTATAAPTSHARPERRRDLSAVVDFVPYEPNERLERALLDEAATNPRARAIIREAAERICEQEYPIARERLLSLVCYDFGMQQARSVRKQQILTLIRSARVFTDPDGFVWPEGVDPAGLTGYRRYPYDFVAIEEIHPRELDNYVRERMGAEGGLDDEQLLHDLLAGLSLSTHRKLTASVRHMLTQSMARVGGRGRYLSD
ncbi:DNA helicase [Actinomyces gaoshouyii]|uniref:DNA helicase n=1 Tax=Actinomyces gaoshouyii TaxID=1960083 RepID=A0A8H9H9D6_9ACTO|nr:DNA helicase [Actinomyces gaoshouyii]